MKDNKPWYEKVGIWVTIIVGICGILGISVFDDISLINNNNAKNASVPLSVPTKNTDVDNDQNNTSSKTITSNSTDEDKTQTITSTWNNGTLIIQSDKIIDAPSNPVKHDIQIIVQINSSSYPENEIEVYNNNKEKELLDKAKEYCENKKYDEAITIYVCDELKDNPYAKINIGYLYAHGYGYEEDVETALKIYDSIDMDIAKRNKLALLITSNTNGNNDVAISDLIDYFTDKNDYYVQNYITNCLYHKNVESLSEEEKNITCTLEDLYILECAGTINSPKSYALNSAYRKLVYNGITFEGEYIKSAYHHYNAYQYMYLDWLEKIYS